MLCLSGNGTKIRLWAFVLIVWGTVVIAHSASSVSVSPSSLIAGQGGWVTVTADVVSGARVDITVLADLGADGVRHPEDVVMRFHEIQDGVPPLVADSPAPGDENPVSGKLTTQLDFWSPINFAGAYIVVVDDGATPDSDTFTIDQTATGQSVSGFLRRQDASPVAGFIIAESSDEEEWAVMTDTTGAFTLQLPEGTLYIGGAAVDLLTDLGGSSAAEITLTAGQTLTGQVLTLLDATRTASGRVVNTTTGQGVAHIQVNAETLEYEDTVDLISFAVTDETGAYQLAVADGDWELFIEGDVVNRRALAGGNFVEGVSVSGASLTGIDFDLFPASTYISGTVTRSSDSLPLAGYEVYAEPFDTAPVEAVDYYAEVACFTSDDGGYVLFVSPDDWNVGIDECSYRKDGFLRPSNQTASPTTGSPALGVDFALQTPSATIDVTVVDDATSAPVAEIWVWVSDSNWNELASGETDGLGAVSLPVQAGDLHVMLSSEDLAELGYIAAPEQQVTIADGQTTPVAFRLVRGESTITGVVRDGGVPLTNLLVSLRDDNGWHLATVRNGAAGVYNFPVMAGDYSVQPEGRELVNRGYAPVSGTAVSVAGGSTVTVDFDVLAPDATLAVVLQTPDNAPVEGARLFLNDSSREYLVDLTSDTSGTATVGLTAGVYWIDISDDILATHNLMRKDARQVTVPVGAPHVEVFTLYSRTARTALDVVLGLITLDDTEAYSLDIDRSSEIDIGDVIALFGLQ